MAEPMAAHAKWYPSDATTARVVTWLGTVSQCSKHHFTSHHYSVLIPALLDIVRQLIQH